MQVGFKLGGNGQQYVLVGVSGFPAAMARFLPSAPVFTPGSSRCIILFALQQVKLVNFVHVI